MVSSTDNKVQEATCEIKLKKYYEWRNASLNHIHNDVPFNISSEPFHQNCSTTGTHWKQNYENCSALIFPLCQLTEPYRKNLICPFSDIGQTKEECECIRPRHEKSIYRNDKWKCTCMDASCGVPKMYNNNTLCTKNFLFTKECIIDNPQVGRYGFSMNCTFINCRNRLENQFYNANYNESELCPDSRQIKIVPHLTDLQVQAPKKLPTTKRPKTIMSTKMPTTIRTSTQNSTSINKTLDIANLTIPGSLDSLVEHSEGVLSYSKKMSQSSFNTIMVFVAILQIILAVGAGITIRKRLRKCKKRECE